ncbi:MAG: MFS transporter [Gammaproteobacteria bacterium]|nr:MFS transporter [Gammaproteobacteria bacterium]
MTFSRAFSRFQPWLVVFSAASFFFFEFINLNSFDALNPYLQASFHTDALTISDLSAFYFYANVLFLIPAGLLLDRYSTRRLLLLASVIAVLATYLFAHTHSLGLAYFSRFLIGLCSTFCLLTTAKLTSRWFPHHLTAVVMGLAITFAMLGGMLAQSLTPLAHAFGDWRTAMDVVVLIGCVVVGLIFCFVQDFPPSYLGQHRANLSKLQGSSFFNTFLSSLLNPQNWISGIYTNLMSIPVVVIGALFAESYLTKTHVLSSSQAAWIASMVFLGVLIGSPLAGMISDRLKQRKVPMMIGAILTLLTSLALIHVENPSAFLLGTLFFLLGFFSSTQVITYALVIEVNPPHLTASSESLTATIIMTAGAIFQPLFGYILNRNWDGLIVNGMPVYSPYAYHQALLILPIAFTACILLAFLIREPDLTENN